MDDSALLRYSRHILLPQIGIEGQTQLLSSRVLILGMGGLGSPVAMYLAASGVGHLTLVDHDNVDLTNLQRQIVHTTDRVGQPKVASAAESLRALNPEIKIETVGHKLSADNLAREAQAADAVVDCTDNFATRHLINRACVAARTPLVSGAVVRFEGQVSVFRPDLPNMPCYRCLYGEDGAPDEPCSQFGVLAPGAGLIGSIQASETIKLLLNVGETLAGRLLIVDITTMEFRTVKLRQDPNCPVCTVH
jgi:adenylyltransferase/sulfurtransferase